jgi:hypothetical protein
MQKSNESGKSKSGENDQKHGDEKTGSSNYSSNTLKCIFIYKGIFLLITEKQVKPKKVTFKTLDTDLIAPTSDLKSPHVVLEKLDLTTTEMKQGVLLAQGTESTERPRSIISMLT